MDEITRNYYLGQRIILLNGLINKPETIEVLARIEYIAQKFPGQELKLLINSPGGIAQYSLLIYDELMKLGIPVATGCAGIAEGAAAMLLAAGTRGRRSALSHSFIRICDIWNARNELTSTNQFGNIEKLRNRIGNIWKCSTGLDKKTIDKWMKNEINFTPEQALEAGIIDCVIPTEKTGGKDGSILRLFQP